MVAAVVQDLAADARRTRLAAVAVSLSTRVSKAYPTAESVLGALQRRGVDVCGPVRQEDGSTGLRWVVDLVDRQTRVFEKAGASVRHAFDGFVLLVLWERQ